MQQVLLVASTTTPSTPCEAGKEVEEKREIVVEDEVEGNDIWIGGQRVISMTITE